MSLQDLVKRVREIIVLMDNLPADTDPQWVFVTPTGRTLHRTITVLSDPALLSAHQMGQAALDEGNCLDADRWPTTYARQGASANNPLISMSREPWREGRGDRLRLAGSRRTAWSEALRPAR